VAYFGASCDTPEYNKEFADELMLDFPLLSDPSRKTAKEYGLVADDKGFPKRWTVYVSKEGKIAFIDKEVKAASHADAIVKKLAELGVEKAEKK
jgi:thioredoxin-dependent peroxiredoxin